MISPGEVQVHAARWRVAPEQIYRDHMISHILAALVDLEFGCWFYGGTALNRSYIPQGRLSEDIDIMVEDITVDIEALLGRQLLATLGATTWDLVSRRSWMHTYQVKTIDGAVKVQLVRFDRDDQRWGWEETEVELRYACLPESVRMRLPERDGFVAMKLGAYTDRWAPRDLLDLANLARIGAITPAAIARYREVTGRGPVLADFERVQQPTREQWEAELSHQVADPGSPDVAATQVLEVLGAALR